MGDSSSWGTVEAFAGEDREAETFFAEAVVAEAGTTGFYAAKIGPGGYGMFQTYAGGAAL